MSEQEIKLSICIPTYNRANTLEILLESIYKQINSHVKEIEICISDNASVDHTREVVEKYKDKLNIIYHRHENVVHGYLNLNYAIDVMPTGEYVLMVGDDDIFINDGIDRMLEMLKKSPSDYYYLNHIHAQIKVNREKVYNCDCKMEYVSTDCESYCMKSGYVSKWEEILNYPGKDQEVNMLFIGNHLMKRGIWKLDVKRFQELFELFKEKPLNEESIEYYYSVWSPQVTIVATAMMGKKCYYCAEPIVCQGMGENLSDLYQVLLLMFLPRWIHMFKELNMDTEEFIKYEEYIRDRAVERYVNLLLYKPALLEEHQYCADFIKELGNTNELFAKIATKLMDKKNDYYYHMVDNYFNNEYERIVSKKNGKVVLWGIGDVARKYLDSSVLFKNTIDYVVDGNLKLHGKVYDKLNLQIHNPEDLKKERIYMIIIASLKYEDEIKHTLQEYGCKKYYIIGSHGLEYID